MENHDNSNLLSTSWGVLQSPTWFTFRFVLRPVLFLMLLGAVCDFRAACTLLLTLSATNGTLVHLPHYEMVPIFPLANKKRIVFQLIALN